MGFWTWSGGGEHASLRPSSGVPHSPAGNMVAKIVSPIVSVVVVTLVGAAVRYFQQNRRRNCFRTHGKSRCHFSFVPPVWKT